MASVHQKQPFAKVAVSVVPGVVTVVLLVSIVFLIIAVLSSDEADCWAQDSRVKRPATAEVSIVFMFFLLLIFYCKVRRPASGSLSAIWQNSPFLKSLTTGVGKSWVGDAGNVEM
jgi:hypothetical protein